MPVGVVQVVPVEITRDGRCRNPEDARRAVFVEYTMKRVPSVLEVNRVAAPVTAVVTDVAVLDIFSLSIFVVGLLRVGV